MDSAIHCSNPICRQCLHVLGSGFFDCSLHVDNNGGSLICLRCNVATRIPIHFLNRMGISIS